MNPRGAVFLALTAGACALALAEPFWGVVAYVVHYHLFPEGTYWGAALNALGFRISFTVTLCLTVGTLLAVLRRPDLRRIGRQEWLYLGFLAWMATLRATHGVHVAYFQGVKVENFDSLDKMLKIAVFALSLTHVVVTPARYHQLKLVFIACAAYIGYAALTASASAFTDGRLNGVGGPDFSESNALSAHMVVMLAFIGVQFLTDGWKNKLLCFSAGGLAADAFVATRSRGGYLAVAVGAALKLLLAPKAGRKRLAAYLGGGLVCSLALIDGATLQRLGTMKSNESVDHDESAQSRLRVWKGGLKMISDHPLTGVGPDNFQAYIGRYAADDEGRDAHETYIRCGAELGLPGLALFLGLVVNAFRTLAKVRSSVAGVPVLENYCWDAMTLQVALAMYLVCCFFTTFVYIEMMWWLLLLPTALERVVLRAKADRQIPPTGADS